MPRLRYTLISLLLAAVVMTGCAGRTVDVVQADQFKLMADRMPDELIARDILDQNRDYVAGLLGSDTNYGQALFQRLSPDFLFEDTVQAAYGTSFAASVLPSDRVQQRPLGFTLRRLRQNITVNMVAITDWNGDGQKDWIVSCTVENARGGKVRDYYVIIADPQEQGPLKGSVAAVYESFGVAGRLYMRDSVRKENAPAAEGSPTAVEEAVPGLRQVTTPPDKKTESRVPQSGRQVTKGKYRTDSKGGDKSGKVTRTESGLEERSL